MERFIDCGVSAFVGTMWEINDELASRFALEFYARLCGAPNLGPVTLGEALRQARLAVRDADPANPTWLAYVLYGDPGAVVSWQG